MSPNPLTTAKRPILLANGSASRSLGALSLLLVVLMAGCGSPEEGPDTNRVSVAPAQDGGSPSDTGSPDGAIDGAADTVSDTVSDGEAGGGAGDADSGDADAMEQLCDGVRCMDSEVCHNDQCLSKAEAQCQGAADEGVLFPGKSLSIKGAFNGPKLDGLETECVGSKNAPEKVYKFDVAEDSLIELSTKWEGFNAKVEFRKGACQKTDSPEKSCAFSQRWLSAESGETVYLVVEPESGTPGSFELEVSATAAACTPGTWSCSSSGGARQRCEVTDGSATPLKFQCLSTASCTNDLCEGTSCQNPIRIDSKGTHQFTGNAGAYLQKMNFKNASKCKTGQSSATSDGQEVIFAVDMKKGQTLTVDPSETVADNLIFVSRGSCEPNPADWSCELATDAGDRGLPPKFEAPADATYYVAIDTWTKIASGSSSIDYTLTLE